MILRINILILLGLLLGLAGSIPGKSACATSIAEQTCDSKVWETMEARARLETEREVMQNQNLIFKPDSILNYTCFDKMADHVAYKVGDLFTHTTYFGPMVIPRGPDGMDGAMTNVVISSMDAYIQANFAHAYLGGRGGDSGFQVAGGAPPTVTPISNQAYSCNVMSQVWAAAKCMNFMHTTSFAESDGFFPFINLAGLNGATGIAGYEGKNDVRQWPTPCGGTSPITGSTWKDMYRKSRNETSFGVQGGLYNYQTTNNSIFTRVRERIDPGSCVPPIMTGVKVILQSGATPYDDGVCTNPGCTFIKNGANGACAPSSVSGGGALPG